MKNYSILFAFTIFIFSFLSTNATHVMGGEFEWEKIGKDTFKITAVIYRDCNGIALNNGNITVTSTCGTIVLSPTRVNTSDVTPVCKTTTTRCANSASTYGYGVERYELAATFVDTFSCCDFNLVWQQCCRNGSITTGAANQNFYIEASMNTCKGSSVAWNAPGATILCLGRDQRFDFGITTDNKNDSVVYKLIAPKIAAAGSVTYTGKYEYDKPINYLGFPRTGLNLPQGFHLDPITGELQFRPMKSEITVFAIEAKVYRNSNLIQSTSRDMQLVVIKCPKNSPPVLTGFNGVSLKSASLFKTICTNEKICIDFETSDPDNKDSVKLSAVRLPNGSSFSIKDKTAQLQQGEFCWTPDSSNTSDIPHKLVLLAKDNSCPTYATQMVVYQIRVAEPQKVNVSLTKTALNNCGEYSFKVIEKNGLKPYSIQWFIQDTIKVGEGDSIYHTFTTTGWNKIKALVNDCDSIILEDSVEIKKINQIKSTLRDTEICQTDTFILNAGITGNNGKTNYTWQVGNNLNFSGKTDTSFLVLPLAQFTNTIKDIISFEVIDADGCSLRDTISFLSKKISLRNIYNSKVICYESVDSLILDTSGSGGDWIGQNVSNNVMSLKGLAPGSYPIAFKSVADLICIIDTALITIAPNPIIAINSDINTCIDADKKVLTALPLGGNWFGNGVNKKGEFDPNSMGQGEYVISYEFTDSLGCYNSDSMKIKVFDYTPIVTVSDTIAECINGDNVDFLASASGGQWKGRGFSSFSNPVSLKPSDFNAGQNVITYTFEDSNECISIDTSILIINELPSPSFKVMDDTVFSGTNSKVINMSVDGNTASYEWLLGNPVFEKAKSFHFEEELDSLGTFDLGLVATFKNNGCTDTISQTNAITVVFSVGFDYQESAINVFPNPVNQSFTIDSDEKVKNIVIYDLTGKEVSRHLNQKTINLTNVHSGTYLLKIETENGLYIKRINKL
ncbi:MAG: T9SS type A sorting domain-containing protein [Bacteroidia bacterium]